MLNVARTVPAYLMVLGIATSCARSLGSQANWRTQPSGFIFPNRQSCTPINLREMALSDGGAELMPR